MKALRVIFGAIGAVVALIACLPVAFEWVFHESPLPSAAFLVVGVVFSLVALAGPFALFMAATLSEGQFTRGNRRFLLGCLLLGVGPTAWGLVTAARWRHFMFGSVSLLAIACLLIVAWCIHRKKHEMPNKAPEPTP